MAGNLQQRRNPRYEPQTLIQSRNTPRRPARSQTPDASEFAVHLDDVRNNEAPLDYQKPDRFFARTYLTKNLSTLASQVIRRLSGERTETSAIFNLATQFGGGKTHALTLLYHLARGGPATHNWAGVSQLLITAGVKEVPTAATAHFVGQKFDSVKGRGSDDGTPVRKTSRAEIAWQIGGQTALDEVAEHEKTMEAPDGDAIRRFLQKNKPCLILIDELMNYVSRNRKNGLGSQLYNFLQNLSEEARSLDNVVLADSIPASELEMTAEDQSDYPGIPRAVAEYTTLRPKAEVTGCNVSNMRLLLYPPPVSPLVPSLWPIQYRTYASDMMVFISAAVRILVPPSLWSHLPRNSRAKGLPLVHEESQ